MGLSSAVPSIGVVFGLVLGGAAAPVDPGAPADPATYLRSLQAEMQRAWPKNRTLRIVCHGHSVPAGYFKTPVVDTFNAYPHLMHRALKRRYPRAVLNVIVTAIGGETSDKGAARFATDVLSLRPDLITIDYGLNDRRIGRDCSRAALVAMLGQAKARGIPVLLLTPTADVRSKLEDPADPLRQQAALIRELAETSGVGLVDSLAAFRAAIGAGTAVRDLMSQGNHPNRRGHDLVVGELMKWFPAARRK